MDAIIAKDIWFKYSSNSSQVIKALDLNVPTGAVTAVLGPNGSGKTTLLGLVIGLLSPQKGELRLMGKPLQEYRKKSVKKLVGLVPQNEIIPFDLSLIEYVLLGRAPFLHLLQQPGERDKKIAEKAIKTVNMEHLMHRSVLTFSSGERQLAAIARSLTQTPNILLLDEPTSHLDLGNSRLILTLLRTISNNGSSVMFSTHDPNAAAAVADHIILFGKNGLVAAGPTKQTLTEENLSTTYEQRVEVIQTHRGPMVLTLQAPDGRNRMEGNGLVHFDERRLNWKK